MLVFSSLYAAVVDLGVDRFFSEGHFKALAGKRVGLVTNQTGVNQKLIPTVELFKQEKSLNLAALFTPEHGLHGYRQAGEKVDNQGSYCSVPVHTLYGENRRPSAEMLKGIDVLVYDIQDIGVRSYTYETTLFYVMEEAAKHRIEVIVLDRPNPINGLTVDGAMLESKWRSFIGYVNVPYCHGMTIGELAKFFNSEYGVDCQLTVIPMKGWKRTMSFRETGLSWIPTSPHIPDEDTPLFYASTGILGELDLVNIGVGYTLPFKVVGAPWIDADLFAEKLNEQKLAGVHFFPTHYTPFYGSFKGTLCHGVLVRVTDQRQYQPLGVQYLLMGLLKSLYPQEVKSRLTKTDGAKKRLFCFANGNEEIYNLLLNERYAAWKMISYQKEEREKFKEIREKYLLY